jgi:predicted MFS family arabinose efflux permease
LTVVPGPFALLLVGRGAQGVGLGLPALMMATARDHLDSRHATRTIALLSVASTAGLGVGYPLAGLLTDMSGIRAAYGLGLVVTAAALQSAVLVLPSERARPAVSVDLRGATVHAQGLLILLTVISQTSLWHRSAAFAVTALVISLAVLSAWAVLELRTANPVVDVRLLRHPAVAAANAAMLVGGVGMYLLLSLITRFVQTPSTAGYGFGLSTFEAGLVLVPFSIMGFVAGKLVPLLRGRVGARRVLAVSTVAILVAFVLFVSARQQLLGAVLAMAVLGAGVGAFSAAMPSVILSVTPEAETASAMGVNQVVRSIGFSIGSAVGGLVLAAHTSGTFPRPSGYTSAAWVGMATTAASLLAIACLSGARSRTVG